MRPLKPYRYRIEKESGKGTVYFGGLYYGKTMALRAARKLFKLMAIGWAIRVWDLRTRQVIWERRVK